MRPCQGILLLVCVIGAQETDTTTSPTETESAETVVTEVVTDTPGGTSVSDNQESSSHVKPENRDKCDKCLKMSFRFRHDNFCGKCEDNGLIDTVEQAELDNIVRCKKCAKTKFRTRHSLFCSATCPSDDKVSTTSTTTTTTTATTTSYYDDSENEVNIWELTKSERRRLKFLKREERRRERERRRQIKEINKVLPTPTVRPVVEPDNRLGPLGNFLKNLIVANTFAD